MDLAALRIGERVRVVARAHGVGGAVRVASPVVAAAAVFGLLVGWLAFRAPSGGPPTFTRTLRFVATDAPEFSPALSPDGKWLAYMAETAGRTDVWVKFLAGGEAVVECGEGGAAVSPGDVGKTKIKIAEGGSAGDGAGGYRAEVTLPAGLEIV